MGYRGALASVFAIGGSISACVLNPEFDPVETDSASSTAVTGPVDTDVDPLTPLGDPCPPLGPPDGTIVEVTPDQASELQSILAGVEPGTTVLLQSGTYSMTDGLWLETPNVTIRSATGNPEDVVLDGGGKPEAMFAPRAANIMIAELTVHQAKEHAVHLSGTSTDPAPGFIGYRLIMTDNGGTAFKVNPSEAGQPADDGLLACSHISVSDQARQQFGAECTNIAGFVGIASYGWHVRDNLIEQIWCPTDFAGGAIRFIESSADPLVERNVIRDCVIGITFGVYEDATPRREYDGERCDGGFYDHYGGRIINNMVTATGTGIAASERGLDSGIGLWQVCGSKVFHNTVVSAISTFTSIEYRFSRTRATVVNNVVSHDIVDRDDAGVPVAGNLQQVELSNFVDPLGGDVHLVPGSVAVDAGIMLGDDAVPHDIDGDPRGSGIPDAGADELVP
jgi:hypothetical protein